VQTRTIGSLEVSVVGLGCNNFGGRIDEPQAREVVDAALEAGITLFDTADSYGATRSEEILGRTLADRRDEVAIATKFGLRIDESRPGGGRQDYVRRACEDSLRRLGTDRVDLYQLHTPDPSTPLAETLGAMGELVRDGKVRELGCSNFSVGLLREAGRLAEPVGHRFVSVQNEYSLLHREPERGVLEECRRDRMGFLPYFPLASGLLTGKYRPGEPPPAGTRLAGNPERAAQLLTDEALSNVEALTALAAHRGHSVLDLAVAWLLTRPAVSCVIAGASWPEQVRDNVAAGEWRLDDETLAAIDGVVPAPA
jgi:aryl-alcohol dehydrogenase-like predicted oxidoreductase